MLIFGLSHFYRRAENWLGVATETYLVIFDSHFYRRAENWLGVATETYLVIFGISDLAIFLDLRSLWSLPYGTLWYLLG